MKLSILICTLTSRQELLKQLMANLSAQVEALGASLEVEILVFLDGKQNTVGRKRNQLLDDAKGEFVVFVDDDDDVADDYVYQILTAIKVHPDIDCIGFRAIMSIDMKNQHQVIYSLQNDSQVESGGTYYRLPGHLTPLRKSAIGDVRFPEKNLGEDADFAGALYRLKKLKKEHFIDKVLYHYQFSAVVSKTQCGRNPPGITGIDRTRFDIVILSNQPDNLRGCLESIEKNEPALDLSRIIVVDDGSKEYCEHEFPGITWVQGQKPFIFARNANLGIKAAPMDVILLNDDARLETRYGFSSQAYATKDRQELGLSSSAIHGFVGNENQKPWSRQPAFRNDSRTLAFISVFIPKDTLDRIGLLDDRFTGYGFEDNDLCLRVRKAALITATYDGCVVEHNSKENKSTYRVKPEISMLLAHNKKIFEEKWKDAR
jgi:GT2 family glycosyltransferase